MQAIRVVLFCFLFCGLQSVVSAQAQTFPEMLNLQTLIADQEYENVLAKKIYSDSSVTAFVIWIKRDVPLHKHITHTEQIYVLEGTANISIGDVWMQISAGTWLIIPENTPHSVSVTSATPLKVLSIQAPEFDGTDRVIIKE
ncbi:MAG: cupin domain-containing protein [Fimbriimonadaceae bacterium]|nr:cupin domain-containing protein [Chitinophagales bacterium]